MSLILIAATSDDAAAAKVRQLVQRQKHDVLMLAVDKVAKGTANFFVQFGDGPARLTYDNRTISLDEIASAWDWHADVYYKYENDHRPFAVRREMQHMLCGLFNAIPEDVWLNPPHRVRNTQEKISQMVHAQNCGLLIPQTILTNRWKDVASLGEKTIFKMPVNGTLEIKSTSKVLYTTVLSKEIRARLENTSPFPGIHQSYIPKKREWRITIVGERIFPVAIYTDKSAKDDWRKHQHNKDKVKFVSEPLPGTMIEEKCKALLRRLGLRYGAFDFIETPDGEMVFLEVNSAGQYGWLERDLRLPISEAIADLLTTIPKRIS